MYEYIFVTAIDFLPLFSLQFLGGWSFTLEPSAELRAVASEAFPEAWIPLLTSRIPHEAEGTKCTDSPI